MELNNKQSKVIIVAVIVIALTVLFPPWKQFRHYKGSYIEKPIGYHFLFIPPEQSGYNSAKINFSHLFLEWFLFALIAGTIFFLYKDKTFDRREIKALHGQKETDSSALKPEERNNNEELHKDLKLYPSSNSFQNEGNKFFGGKYHPWRRLFARTVDLLFLGSCLIFIISFLFGCFFPNNIETFLKIIGNPIIVGIVMYILWLPVEAAFISNFGTTPGKWIFGIRVIKSNGVKLFYSEALERVLRVWIQGDGFGFPIATFFTRLFAYYRLTRTGTTPWDNSVDSMVTHSEWGPLRAIICTLSVISIPIFFNFLNHLDYKEWENVLTPKKSINFATRQKKLIVKSNENEKKSFLDLFSDESEEKMSP